jgi:hypothetical protein
MSDTSAHGEMHHVNRVPKAEFFVYFAMIFALALLPHVLGWTIQMIRHMALPRLSPWARAWKDAQAVTPMIFRG